MDGLEAVAEIWTGDDKVQNCAPHAIWERLGEKWTILVLALLSTAPNGRLRHSDLKRRIEGVSQRMLTLTLRNLERDGLLSRQVFPEVPPRVEYQATPLAESLLPAMQSLAFWIGNNWSEIEAARLRYERNAYSVASE